MSPLKKHKAVRLITLYFLSWIIFGKKFGEVRKTGLFLRTSPMTFSWYRNQVPDPVARNDECDCIVRESFSYPVTGKIPNLIFIKPDLPGWNVDLRQMSALDIRQERRAWHFQNVHSLSCIDQFPPHSGLFAGSHDVLQLFFGYGAVSVQDGANESKCCLFHVLFDPFRTPWLKEASYHCRGVK